MKSKAFIFSITALYFVILFLLFLSLFLFTYSRNTYRQDVSLNDRTSWKYLTNAISETEPPSPYWCVVRLVYDANISNQNPSTITTKKFCEARTIWSQKVCLN